MSERDDLSLEIFQQFAKPWITLVSKNRYLDINIVKEYPDKPWVFSSLSNNYKIALPILHTFAIKIGTSLSLVMEIAWILVIYWRSQINPGVLTDLVKISILNWIV